MRPAVARLWVAITLGCADGAASPLESPGVAPSARGDLEVITMRTGPRVEPDGGELTLNGGTYVVMSSEDTVRIVSVPVAEYLIGLTGTATACKVGGGNPRGIRVEPDVTTRVIFVLKCAPDQGPGIPTS